MSRETAPRRSGSKHEVDVVRHQAEGMDANAVATGEDVEAVEVAEEVFRAVEGVLALRASLVDVIDLSAFPIANPRRVELISLSHLCQ